jgi:FKBP-type peptidyl-prolyl cis-trans isomerase 2
MDRVEEGTIVFLHMETRDAATGEILETTRLEAEPPADADATSESPDIIDGQPRAVCFRGEQDRLQDVLEEALFHKPVGASFEVTALPDSRGTGEYDPECLLSIPAADLPEEARQVAETNQIGAWTMALDAEGQPCPVLYRGPDADRPGFYLFDFNEPLAGRTVIHAVEVVAVRRATPEETRKGTAHPTEEDLDLIDPIE